MLISRGSDRPGDLRLSDPDLFYCYLFEFSSGRFVTLLITGVNK